MYKRRIIAVVIAYFVASYASDLLYGWELARIFGPGDYDARLIIGAPIFVGIRYIAVIMGTLLGGRETFSQEEFRLPFAVFLLVLGGVYVLVRYAQDRRQGDADKSNAV